MPVLKTSKRSVYPAWMATPFTLWLLSTLFFFFSTNDQIHAQAPVAKEYQVKALFLYNFTQFVQWPPHSFEQSDGPLIIGILGEDPFGSYIDELVKGEVIGNHPLTVRRFSNTEQIGDCHLLYINLKEKDQITKTLALLRKRPILTVSEADDFARIGGMIRFIRDDERIRLRINTTAVAEAQLVISSKLLRLSEIVTGKIN